MNVKTGIEAEHFLEKEYLNGIFVTVWVAAFVLDPSAYSLSSSWFLEFYFVRQQYCCAN